MSACKFVASTQPRIIPRRHTEDCADPAACAGCEPCAERHCQVCGIEHVTVEGQGNDETCAECLSATRDDLSWIVGLSARAITEAVHKGVNSEAANLAGRAIDTPEGIEAWGYRSMSAVMGRIPALEVTDERHPTWVLGSWEMLVREHLTQPSSARIHIAPAASYLGGHLTRLAHDAEFAFDELSKDLRRCRAHLENVLHEGDRPERSQVSCLDCGRRLERHWGKDGVEEYHRCPKCPRVYDAGEFARAKANWLASEGADRYVLIADAAKAIERSEFTIRTWIRRGSVGAVCDVQTHRLQVWWPEVRAQHAAKRVAEQKKAAS